MPILQDDVISAMSGMYEAADAFGNTESLSSMDPWYGQWYQNQQPEKPPADTVTGPVGMPIGANIGGVPENSDTTLHGGVGNQQPQPQTTALHTFDVHDWMSQNGYGQASYDALTPLGPNNLPSTNGKWYLRPDTAAAFQAAEQAYHQQTGGSLLEGVVSMYRNFGTPYETQRHMDWHQSDHASGGSVDLAPGSAQWNWFKAHAAQYGFGVWGGNWGDPGHFSFSAGGFNGWMTSYSGPTAADQKWIAAARGSGGFVPPPGGPPNGGTQAELMRLVSPVIRPEDAGAGLGGAAVPFASVLSGILRPLFTLPKQRQQKSGGSGGGQNPAPPKPGMNGVPGIPGQVRVLMQNLHFGTVQNRYNSIIQDFIRAGRATGIDPRLLAMIGQHESEFDPTVVSSAGYGGIMQINVGTHPNWANAAYNTMEGAKELLGWMQLAQSRGLDPLKYGLAYYNVGGYASQSAIQAAIRRYSDTIIQNYQAQA